MEALVKVAMNDRADLHIPVYSAVNGLIRLAHSGSTEQRLQMREKVLQQGLLELCLEACMIR